MTIRTSITRRGVLTIADDAEQQRGHGNSAPTRLAMTVADYKGDLPLNPVKWCRIDVTETWHGKNGRAMQRGVTLMLNEENRAALIDYLTK